jgi:hypothetical protein
LTNISDPIAELIEQLRNELSATFLATKINDSFGDAINWPTLQNQLPKDEELRACFIKRGHRWIVIRDRLLRWWAKKLAEAATHPPPPRPKRGRPRRLPDPTQPEA